jgi:tripartite ATP-independent transporter DctM subunit
MLSGTSIGALFLGGMVPGVAIAILLGLYVSFISKKRNYPPGYKFGTKDFWRTTFKALPALLTPVILLGGIYTGIMTPTEAGAVAALYALLIAIFAYKVIGFKDMIKAVKDTAISTAQITILTGAAGVFSYMVAKENIPQMLSGLFLSISNDPIVFLLAVNVLILLLGMFLDTAVIQFVFLPMLIPIAKLLNIDMVQFGVITSLNMMIGLSTPPFGFLLFVTSAISNTPYSKIVKEIMPMILLLIGLLLAITFVPQIVTFIPSLLK